MCSVVCFFGAVQQQQQQQQQQSSVMAAGIFAHCYYELDDCIKIAVTVDKKANVRFKLIFSSKSRTIQVPIEMSCMSWLLEEWPPKGYFQGMSSESLFSGKCLFVHMKDRSTMLITREVWEKLRYMVSRICNDITVFECLIRHSDSLLLIRNSAVLQHLLYAYVCTELENVEERLCQKCANKEEASDHAVTCIKHNMGKRIAYATLVKDNISAEKLNEMLMCSGIGMLDVDNFNFFLDSLSINHIAENKCYYIIAQTLVHRMNIGISPDVLTMMSALSEKFNSSVSVSLLPS